MRQLTLFALLLVFCMPALPQNNSIKGLVWGFGEPIFFLGVWQTAISYERKLASNQSVVVDGSFLHISGASEDCTPKNSFYSASVSYRYYFSSNSKFVHNLWLSPGLKFLKNDKYSCYEEYVYTFYGFRLMLGKPLRLPKVKSDKWQMDIGLGVNYGYREYSSFTYTHSYFNSDDVWVVEDITEIPSSSWVLLPEFVLRIGVSF